MTPLYEISKVAEEDWSNIARYTLEKFGEKQVQRYTNQLVKCIEDLANNVGLYKEKSISNHRVLIKRCQKHYIFSLIQDDKPILIIAIFHEKMDLMKRLKSRLK